jgi:hypothetical protein
MKLYLVKRNDPDYGWDISLGFVIAADSKEEAYKIALEEGGGDDWKTKNNEISVEEIGEAKSTLEKGVILEDYKAG